MKKIGFLLLALVIGGISFASFITPKNARKASEILIPIGNNTEISLKDLSLIKVKDYELLTGKHLNLFQKMSFKMGQKKLRKSISADGTINNDKLAKVFAGGDFTSGFNGGWFVLGLLLGLIGVLLSYVINGDEGIKKNRQKWAWIGFGVWVVIWLIFIVL